VLIVVALLAHRVQSLLATIALFVVGASRSPISTASQTQYSLVAVVGRSISLSCAAADPQVMILAWDYYPYTRAGGHASRRVTVYSSGTPSYDLDPRFVLAGCQLNNCSLVIHELQLSDAGHFVCVPRDSDATNVSLTVIGTYVPLLYSSVIIYNKILSRC